MKTILAITVCKNNRPRVFNQVENLLKNSSFLSKHNIHPIFVTSKSDDLVLNEFKVLKLDLEDKYTNLYKKIFSMFDVLNKEEFDFLCKIDDDTFINFNEFNYEYLKNFDYIGRVANSFTGSHITINFNMFMINNKIDFYPSKYFNKPFKFCSGDCYFLSKKAINLINSKNQFLNNLEAEIVCEDQLVGFLLDKEDILIKDITESSLDISKNSLQITKNFFSIHPINEKIFKNLITLNKEDQMKFLEKNKFSNHSIRLAYLHKLQDKIKQEVINFYNETKLIGLG